MTSASYLDSALIPVATAAAMREFEADCFDRGGISERVVMEAAGRSVAIAADRFFPDSRILAVAGKGNNGGDCIVAARALFASGRDVQLLLVGRDDTGDLSHDWEFPRVRSVAEAGLSAGDLVVDGLLGTGASGAPRDPYDQAIAEINESPASVLAIDGPSGIDLTTGGAAGEAIQADLTVTFGALKRGLLVHPGRSYAGSILLAEVGFPPISRDRFDALLVTGIWAATRLPRIDPDAHKGSVGRLTIVAGRSGVGGAAVMAAMAALRTGVGGVHVVSAAENRIVVQTSIPEAIFHDRDGDDLDELLRSSDAVLVGPGIGTDEAAGDLLKRVLGEAERVVLDADALTLLARSPNLLSSAEAILTPHPGELGRILGRETSDVLEDRFAAASAAAEAFGAVVLSKGAPSIVATPGAPTLINHTGHSGVATAGMGDTLAGIVAGLLSMRTEPSIAASLGVFLAGHAADVAGRGRSLLPRDVAEALPEALASLGEAPLQLPFLYLVDAAV